MQVLQLSSSNKRHHRHMEVCIKGQLPSQAIRVGQPWRGASAMTRRPVAAAGSAAAGIGPRGLLQPPLLALLRTQVSHFQSTLSLAGHHDTSQGNGSRKRLSHIKLLATACTRLPFNPLLLV